MRINRRFSRAITALFVIATLVAIPASVFAAGPCTFEELFKTAVRSLGVFTLENRSGVVTAFRLTITAENINVANSSLGLNSTLETIGPTAAAKFNATYTPAPDQQGVHLAFYESSYLNPCGGDTGGLPAVNPVVEPAQSQAEGLDDPGVVTAVTSQSGQLNPLALGLAIGTLIFVITIAERRLRQATS